MSKKLLDTIVDKFDKLEHIPTEPLNLRYSWFAISGLLKEK